MRFRASATVVVGAVVGIPRHNKSYRIALDLAICLGVLALAVVVALSIVLPVFRFPKPSGRYGIGTVTYHWMDTSRTELFSVDATAHRELMVQVWYPATEVASSPRAP